MQHNNLSIWKNENDNQALGIDHRLCEGKMSSKKQLTSKQCMCVQILLTWSKFLTRIIAVGQFLERRHMSVNLNIEKVSWDPP